MAWTRVIDADEAARSLPAWVAARMVGARGRFGLLLTTGDVLRITSITAANLSSDGTILLDVLLDHAGAPDGIDLAWQPKHYLGAPVPGATLATVNMAQVVTAVEFVATEIAEPANDIALVEDTDMPLELVGAEGMAASR
ncbi:hypothetical protein [Roseomonas sp. WA12]